MAISVSSMASFLLLVSLTVFLTGPSLCNALVGGKSDIPNVKSNKEVQDLGSWCVSEYNRQQHRSLTFKKVTSGQQHRSLTFKKVTSGQQQVVAGMNYYLHIQTVDGGATKYYDAVVWVRAWLSSKQLLSFQPAA